MADISVREALEDAFDDHEEISIESDAEIEGAAEQPVFEEPGEEDAGAADSTEVAAEAQEAEAAPEKAEKPIKTEKAPLDWGADSREHWDKLPDSVKTQVLKRDREINVALQQSAEARKAASQFAKTLQPYQTALQSAGYKDPYQAVQQAVGALATLASGTQQQKADLAAALIKDFGVDIKALDSRLVGEQYQSPTNDVEALLEKKLAPFNQYIQTVQQQEQMQRYQAQQEAHQSVSQFSEGKEFINDVRPVMANLLDAAAASGIPLSLDDAYKQACQMHPQVRQVIEGRNQQSRLQNSAGNIARKRSMASASLTGKQSGQPASQKTGIRELLAENWNK